MPNTLTIRLLAEQSHIVQLSRSTSRASLERLEFAAQTPRHRELVRDSYRLAQRRHTPPDLLSGGPAIIPQARCRHKSRPLLQAGAGGGKCPGSCPDKENGTTPTPLCKSIGQTGKSALANPQYLPDELLPIQLLYIDGYSIELHRTLGDHPSGFASRHLEDSSDH